MPLVFPYLALAVALLVTFVSVGIRLSIATIVVGHTIVAIPYTVIIVGARLAGVDRAMEEAALDLGASRFPDPPPDLPAAGGAGPSCPRSPPRRSSCRST